MAITSRVYNASAVLMKMSEMVAVTAMAMVMVMTMVMVMEMVVVMAVVMAMAMAMAMVMVTMIVTLDPLMTTSKSVLIAIHVTSSSWPRKTCLGLTLISRGLVDLSMFHTHTVESVEPVANRHISLSSSATHVTDPGRAMGMV